MPAATYTRFLLFSAAGRMDPTFKDQTQPVRQRALSRDLIVLLTRQFRQCVQATLTLLMFTIAAPITNTNQYWSPVVKVFHFFGDFHMPVDWREYSQHRAPVNFQTSLRISCAPHRAKLCVPDTTFSLIDLWFLLKEWMLRYSGSDSIFGYCHHFFFFFFFFHLTICSLLQTNSRCNFPFSPLKQGLPFVHPWDRRCVGCEFVDAALECLVSDAVIRRW